MSHMALESYAAGHWLGPANSADAGARRLFSAVTGEVVGSAGNHAIDTQAMLDHARTIGGASLRAMTFHERARMLKAIAQYLGDHKDQLYALSTITGATRSDAMIDVDGGIGTVFVYASKGRRELPDAQVLLDGELEQLSRTGTFVGQHIATPKLGVAIHINAFNFPVWGMLEKLAPALLAGMPVIVKPATASAFVAEACFRLLLDSQVLPEGSVQLLLGNTGDLLQQVTSQDVISFTGSADTALTLRSSPHLIQHAVPFIAEQDSLNASVLGPDADIDTPEFNLFVKEVVHEMTAKAGQKWLETTQMGALVSNAQKQDVLHKLSQLQQEASMAHGTVTPHVEGADANTGAFVSPMLLHCANPDSAQHVHEIEAFGPVATVMPYRNLDHACTLLNRGGGSLVASLITHDPNVAQHVAIGAAAWHGRIYINDRDSMQESTGHGSPLPHMVHGGPGRAGGGEELGGIRGVLHYMQRTAIQGSPNMISAVGNTWVPNAACIDTGIHPFRQRFDELQLGETLTTQSRSITIEDIEQFAHFTGDTFYAHMDEAAAAASPFFEGRVAHGYLLLSFAAGLFVEPSPGPVLANTGLDGLRFYKPVSPGDSISVKLTVKRKTRRTDTYGEVRWHVAISNQNKEQVASYELHTMNAY